MLTMVESTEAHRDAQNVLVFLRCIPSFSCFHNFIGFFWFCFHSFTPFLCFWIFHKSCMQLCYIESQSELKWINSLPWNSSESDGPHLVSWLRLFRNSKKKIKMKANHSRISSDYFERKPLKYDNELKVCLSGSSRHMSKNRSSRLYSKKVTRLQAHTIRFCMQALSP